ncbi:GAF domain-containing protein [Amycolatopsis sp. K13G38]|uniref:histidine kinase n=1 Tax=Amycolatopsis acididurans TaxID=2724524 RepID=A0ABX1J2C6_9PSEU|nr:ATP-binding protein [Amycolatopsis acididurans]NKQ52510.1 GAF domain-containing protein [Amycolatopsis acididurans]
MEAIGFPQILDDAPGGLAHDDTVALLRRQTAVLERIAAGAPLAEVLTEVVTAFEDLVPRSRCSILLLDAATATLRHAAAPSLPADYSAEIDGLLIGREAGSCGSAAYLGVPIVAEDIASDPRWVAFRGAAGRAGLRACWSTPIRGRAGVLGTFAVYHDTPHRPSLREERLVDQLTHVASVAIDHDGLFGALAESEERFRRAFEDNVVGMALTDVGGTVARVNHALCELLGCSEFELIGARLDTVLVPARPLEGRAFPAEYEATARGSGGRELDLLVTVSPVRDTHGATVRLSVTVLDVTQRRAAEAERRRRHEAETARSAAEVASKAKTDFIAALGHELRTPLQAITGFTELLGELDLSRQRRRAALEHIDSACRHILSLVDDVLDVSRIEAGALSLHPADVDVDAVVAEVVALLEPLAEAERVTVRRSGRAGTVFGDPRRVTQVLLNLVGNAIRYNRAGGAVDVEAARAGDHVVVAVRDTGAGLAPEHLERLFVPFDRLGADRDQGVGLGLPLARGLTEAMDGTLDVVSAPEEGTTVTVSLPARCASIEKTLRPM